MHAAKKQSGQVMVIVAVWLIALIGSAALILLTGSVEWQRNQSQQLADQAALDAALKIGVGCTAGSASTVITEADNFVATQRTRTGALTIGAGTCSGGYAGTDTFAGGLSETIHYPYRGHQQQVEVILTVSLPISFGSYMGASNTNVTRRAVAQQLNGDMPAVSATSLACTGGQFNVGGSVVAANAITLSGGCAIYAHQRLDAASSTYSDLGDTSVYANGQSWVGGGGLCVAGANTGSTNSVCADGYEVSGHNATTCGASGTSAFLSAGNAAINANPCAAGTGPQPVAPVSTALPPEPNTDPAAIATLRNNAGGPLGAACNAAGVYPNITAGGTVVGTGLGPSPASADASGFYHFKPSCYGYLNLSTMAGGISARQIGAESARQRHFITATMPAASQAGTLLVATVSAETTPNKFAATAGWVSASEANQVGEGRSEIWYYPNNPGGINSVTLTMNPATVNGNAQLSEWTGVAVASPLDQSGSQAVAVPTTTTTVSTGGALTQTGELVITIDGFQNLPGQTFDRGRVRDSHRGRCLTLGKRDRDLQARGWRRGRRARSRLLLLQRLGFRGRRRDLPQRRRAAGARHHPGVRQPGRLLHRHVRAWRWGFVRRCDLPVRVDAMLDLRLPAQLGRRLGGRRLYVVCGSLRPGPERGRQLPGFELVPSRRPGLLEPPGLGAGQQHGPDRDPGHLGQALDARLGVLAGHLHGHRERQQHDRRDDLLRDPFSRGGGRRGHRGGR